MLRPFWFVCLVSILITSSAAAQDGDDRIVRFMDDWRTFTALELGLMDAGEIAFDRDKARQGGYGESGVGLMILPVSARFLRLINVKAEFGILMIEDEDPIMNEVVCISGCTNGMDFEPHVAESDVSSFTFSAATGLATPPLALGPVGLTAGCNLGWQAAWPHRDIGACQDCDEEDLPALSGAFLEPTLLLGYGARASADENFIFGVRAAYRDFITGDDLRYFWTLGLAFAVYLENRSSDAPYDPQEINLL